MRYLALLVAVALLPLQGCRNQTRAGIAGSAAPLVRPALRLLRADVVGRIEIYAYLPGTETLIHVTPQHLERVSPYLVVLRGGESVTPVEDGLAQVLETARIARGKMSPDCRWGCVCYDRQGRRVLTIYSNGSGFAGLIDGTPVTGMGDLDAFVDRTCESLWR